MAEFRVGHHKMTRVTGEKKRPMGLGSSCPKPQTDCSTCSNVCPKEEVCASDLDNLNKCQDDLQTCKTADVPCDACPPEWKTTEWVQYPRGT